VQDRFPTVVVGAAGTRVSRAIPMPDSRVCGLMHRSQISDLVFLVVIVFARIRKICVGSSVTDAASAVALIGASRQHGPVRDVRIPGKRSASRTSGCQRCSLVRGFDGDDQVGGVGHHHVRHLEIIIIMSDLVLSTLFIS
jgi:hypothetical protein